MLLFLCKLFESRFKNKTVHACCLISLCNANGIIGLGCTWSWHNRHRPPAEFRNGMTLMTAGRLAITFSACRRRFLLAATLPLSSSCLLCLFASQEVVAKCRWIWAPESNYIFFQISEKKLSITFHNILRHHFEYS